MTVRRHIRTWHRRLSLVIGIQLLLWTTSGLVFSWDPIGDVRGESDLRELEVPDAPPIETLVDPATAARAAGLSSVTEAHLAWRRERWTWLLTPSPSTEAAVVVDASTGEPLPPLSAREAEHLARRRFAPSADVVDVTRVTEASGEYRDKVVPAWRVRFDDALASHVYVTEATGDIGAVRNDLWRRFDFFWMLHIMDYADRSDFGTPWLKAASLLGVSTAVTGLWLGLLVLRGGRRRTEPSDSPAYQAK